MPFIWSVWPSRGPKRRRRKCGSLAEVLNCLLEGLFKVVAPEAGRLASYKKTSTIIGTRLIPCEGKRAIDKAIDAVDLFEEDNF